jgi:uncharacterized cupin superfamily protein
MAGRATQREPGAVANVEHALARADEGTEQAMVAAVLRGASVDRRAAAWLARTALRTLAPPVRSLGGWLRSVCESERRPPSRVVRWPCPTSALIDERRSRMKVFNLYNGELGNSSDREGWRFKATPVGKHIGGELIGAGCYEVEPGNKLWPYHTHHANEEWLVVVRGQPTLRTPEGERQLDEGDVVCFPRGKAGAHQVRNGTDSPVRILMLSTLIAPDISEFLDTGKVGARSVAGVLIMFGRPGPELDYWEGED